MYIYCTFKCTCSSTVLLNNIYIMENQRIHTDGKHSDQGIDNNYRRQVWQEKTKQKKLNGPLKSS